LASGACGTSTEPTISLTVFDFGKPSCFWQYPFGLHWFHSGKRIVP
jgi:hypothetical protein